MKNDLLHGIVSKRNLTILYLLTYGSTRTEGGCRIGWRMVRVSHLYYNFSEKRALDGMFEERLVERLPETRAVVATAKGKTYLDKMLKVFPDIRPILEEESKKMFQKGMEKMDYTTIKRREQRMKEKERRAKE